MDNPFIAGFQTGIELQRLKSEREYKEGLLSRMQKENEVRDYELQKTKASDKAPEDFLRNLAEMQEVPLSEEDSGARQAAGITDPSLPQTKTVPLSAEDRLARLNMAIAKYPEKAQVLGTLAVNDPVLGPALKLKALQEKMAEKNMEWGFKKQEKTFDTDQDIRKENVRAGNEMTRTVVGKSIEHLSKINEKNVVMVSDPNNPEMKLPYDTNTNQPMALVKPIDPADPKKGSTLVPNPAYNNQGNSWKLTPEVAKAIIKTNPDVVTSKSGKAPTTEQEFDTIAKSVAENPAFASEVMQRYQQKFSPVLQGGQAAGQGGPAVQTPVSGWAIPTQQVQAPSGGFLDTILGTAKSVGSSLAGLLPDSDKSQTIDPGVRNRILYGEGGASPSGSPSPSSPSSTTIASGEKPMDPVTRVVTAGDVKNAVVDLPSKVKTAITVDRDNVQGSFGRRSLEEFAGSQRRPGSEHAQNNEVPREKLQAGGVTVWAKSTTLTRARGLLEKIFPELSANQIQRILEPVRGKGEFSESVDMEKLRRDIDELYALAAKSR